jgi:hypothetical protein
MSEKYNQNIPQILESHASHTLTWQGINNHGVTGNGPQFECRTEVEKDEALNWLLAISQFMYGQLK